MCSSFVEDGVLLMAEVLMRTAPSANNRGPTEPFTRRDRKTRAIRERGDSRCPGLVVRQV